MSLQCTPPPEPPAAPQPATLVTRPPPTTRPTTFRPTTPPPYEMFARACENSDIKYDTNDNPLVTIHHQVNYIHLPSLECPDGKQIHVEYANYGRKIGRQICPHATVTVSYIFKQKNITIHQPCIPVICDNFLSYLGEQL